MGAERNWVLKSFGSGNILGKKNWVEKFLVKMILCLKSFGFRKIIYMKKNIGCKKGCLGHTIIHPNQSFQFKFAMQIQELSKLNI